MIDPIELHALADGELSPERERALREQLKSCPESEAEFQSIVAIKHFVAERAGGPDCDRQWSACRSRLRDLEKTRRIERVVSGRTAWGLAGTLFAVILFAGMGSRGNESPNVHSADLARIVASIGPSRAAHQSGANDARWDSMLAQAKRWVDPNRLTLISQAIGEIDGRPVARLTLRDASGDLAMVVVPEVLKLDGLDEAARNHSFKVGHVGQLNCVAWTDGRYTLMLVGDRAHEDLITTASRITFQQAAR